MYTCEYTLVQEIIYLNIDLCFYVRIYILMCIYIDKYLYESACLYIYIYINVQQLLNASGNLNIFG